MTRSRGADRLARVAVQALPPGGESGRTGVVVAVKTGPARLDVTVGGTVIPDVRYSTSYAFPAPGDVVMVKITQPGGSGRRGGRTRGGRPYVESRVAT